MPLHFRRSAALLALTASLLTAACAAADPTGDTIRSLAEKYQAAAVTITAVIHVSGAGEAPDTEVTVPGFVVDPSGLVVTSDVAIDPTSVATGETETKITAKVVSAKILTSTGDTIAAQVTLRDNDRDIAFLRPITPPAAPMTYIDLKSAAPARLGDQVFLLSALGRAGNHATAVLEDRVIGLIEHPRTLYVPSLMAAASVGNAVFGENGSPLGIITLRFTAGKESTSLIQTDRELAVIVPGADIQEEVPQALSAKVPAAAAPPAKRPARPAGSGAAAGAKPHS